MIYLNLNVQKHTYICFNLNEFKKIHPYTTSVVCPIILNTYTSCKFLFILTIVPVVLNLEIRRRCLEAGGEHIEPDI